MQPEPPPALQLALRLKELRRQWPRLTQEKLARAFGEEEHLAAVTVSSWESLKSPKLPPVHRIQAYARFFATPRSVQGKPKLFPLDELSQDERRSHDRLEAELMRLRSAAIGESPGEQSAFGRSWIFPDGGTITFVCAQKPTGMIGACGDPQDPNYTELQTYADIDALVELFGHIRSENPSATVQFRTPSDLAPDDLTGHLILLGNVARNEITGMLSDIAKLPVRQADRGLESGEIFIAGLDGEEREFEPQWTDENKKALTDDVGLLARVPNPLNINRTLTICNGIYSRGVYGAVRSLTDAQMRDGNERYVSKNFGDTPSFGILMSVKVIKNSAMTPDFNIPGVVLHQWLQDAGERR
jgi:transcriptional regulator with XRE-family HTH domain